MDTLGKIAVVFIILGAVLLAGPVYGFTSIASERGVQVSTAEGTSAYLGMESTDNSVNGVDGTAVAILHNNLESDMTFTDISIDITGDNNLLDESNTPTEIGAGNNKTVDVVCEETVGGPPDGASGVANIHITVEQADANGVTITDASLKFDSGYDCHQSADDENQDESGEECDGPPWGQGGKPDNC
ncbi:hypothetical protein [Natronorubrum sulfidifaciens]|uniref:hypothetical protein n=1 Tax=Natronorubrum sulfidifaciens TaxID=388259 RepID=UPI0012674047|nr:hypothetical protein [Natronorubrum sulfidifaciens]